MYFVFLFKFHSHKYHIVWAAVTILIKTGVVYSLNLNGLRVLLCNYVTPKPFAFQTMWKSSLANGQCAEEQPESVTVTVLCALSTHLNLIEF